MQITVPPVPEGKDRSSWRRFLTGMDPSKDKSFRALGPWLQAGDLVEVPEGSLVLAVDRALRGFKDEFVPRDRYTRGFRIPKQIPQKDATVTVYLAAGGELVELWSRQYINGNSAFGATTTKKLAALLDQHPVPEGGPAVLHEARRPNIHEGKCRWCAVHISAERGHLVGHGEETVVEHYEQCPAQSVPREPDGVCALCGVEVVPHQAQMHLVRDGSGTWEIRHNPTYNDRKTCLEQPVASPQEQRAAQEERDRIAREARQAARAEEERKEAKKREAREKRQRKAREAREAEAARVAGLKRVDRKTTGVYDKGLGDGMRARMLEHLDTLEDSTTTKCWTVETYYEGLLGANEYGDYDEGSIDTTYGPVDDKEDAHAHYRTFTFQPGLRGRRASQGSAPSHGPCAECGQRGGTVLRSDSSGVQGWVCDACDRGNPDDYLLSFG